MSPDPDLLTVVPHRPPILRVERLIACTATTAVVTGREPDGPGALPWALGAIEGIAQSAAAMLGHGRRALGATVPPRGMLVAVKRFAVAGQPAPRAELTYRVELVRRLDATALLRGRVEQDGRLLATGELMLWTSP